jgi:hypothetical protein
MGSGVTAPFILVVGNIDIDKLSTSCLKRFTTKKKIEAGIQKIRCRMGTKTVQDTFKKRIICFACQ